MLLTTNFQIECQHNFYIYLYEKDYKKDVNLFNPHMSGKVPGCLLHFQFNFFRETGVKHI